MTAPAAPVEASCGAPEDGSAGYHHFCIFRLTEPRNSPPSRPAPPFLFSPWQGALAARLSANTMRIQYESAVNALVLQRGSALLPCARGSIPLPATELPPFSLSTVNLRPHSPRSPFPCHTSQNSPVRPIIVVFSETGCCYPLRWPHMRDPGGEPYFSPRILALRAISRHNGTRRRAPEDF